MKTAGPVNIWHLVPWVRMHLTDAERQALGKVGREGRRARRHLARLAAKMLRKVKGDRPDPAREEVSIPPADLKFPPIGLGMVLFRMEPLGPTLDGSPLQPVWRRFENGELEPLHQCFEDLGKWHSGYAARQGVTGAMKPEWYAHTDNSDMRFYQGTLTLPQWDSEALSESLKEGEVSAAAFNGLLDRLRLRLTDGKFEKLVSCGQSRRMVMTGIFVHPQDGVIHLHPVFLRSSRLAFLKNDGRLLPACMAPKGGRRTKGEGWVGGDPLGFKPSKGQWVTNSIGVALCAADALKKEKIPPPRQNGDDWLWLHRIITERMKGSLAKKKGDRRARSLGLGTPYDLWGSRVLRQEVRSLGQQNVAFRIRRERKIAEAKATQEATNQCMVDVVAGKELSALAVERDTAVEENGKREKERFESEARADEAGRVIGLFINKQLPKIETVLREISKGGPVTAECLRYVEACPNGRSYRLYPRYHQALKLVRGEYATKSVEMLVLADLIDDPKGAKLEPPIDWERAIEALLRLQSGKAKKGDHGYLDASYIRWAEARARDDSSADEFLSTRHLINDSESSHEFTDLTKD
jgi:hypothetical protein